MWQDKFWNSCVAKEASRTSIPPPPPGPPPPPLRRLQRPTVNNSNFLMGPNFNRRTPTGLGQPEVETIRELVK